MSYACGHGIIRANHIIPNCEGRNTPFSFMVTRLPTAPKLVVFDFACACAEYSLNREAEKFKNTVFALDELHKWNHPTCSDAFRIRNRYGDLLIKMGPLPRTTGPLATTSFPVSGMHYVDGINTQSCEQYNAVFEWSAASIQQSGQASAMRTIRLKTRDRNAKKNERLLRMRLARGRLEVTSLEPGAKVQVVAGGRHAGKVGTVVKTSNLWVWIDLDVRCQEEPCRCQIRVGRAVLRLWQAGGGDADKEAGQGQKRTFHEALAVVV